MNQAPPTVHASTRDMVRTYCIRIRFLGCLYCILTQETAILHRFLLWIDEPVYDVTILSHTIALASGFCFSSMEVSHTGMMIPLFFRSDETHVFLVFSFWFVWLPMDNKRLTEMRKVPETFLKSELFLISRVIGQHLYRFLSSTLSAINLHIYCTHT